MKIVPASAWRRLAWGRLTPLTLPVDELWVHHGAAGTPTLATLLGYERFHVLTKGWRALGYCWAIDGNGTVYEGRGANVGGHTYGRNTRSVGVLLIGDWTSGTAPEPMVKALAVLTRHLHATGVLTRPHINGGHGDAPGQSTTCPGTAGQDAIVRARALLNAPPSVRPADLEDDEVSPELEQMIRDIHAGRIGGRTNIGDDVGRIRRSTRNGFAALRDHFGLRLSIPKHDGDDSTVDA